MLMLIFYLAVRKGKTSTVLLTIDHSEVAVVVTLLRLYWGPIKKLSVGSAWPFVQE